MRRGTRINLSDGSKSIRRVGAGGGALQLSRHGAPSVGIDGLAKAPVSRFCAAGAVGSRHRGDWALRPAFVHSFSADKRTRIANCARRETVQYFWNGPATGTDAGTRWV